MSNIKETVWEIEPHTKAKHEILKRYLQAWFPILSRYSGRVVYIDGFAGPGIYKDGGIGSPIIAIDCLLGHQLKNQLLDGRREFVFIFMEEDKKREQVLEQVLNERYPQPIPNITIAPERGNFETVMSNILRELKIKNQTLAPTFAFLDPFGWDGMQMETISEMMSHERCEILINFMSGFVHRFVGVEDNREKSFNRLFGIEKWKKVRELPSNEQRQFILDLYKSQLKTVAHANYVRSFEMKNRFGQVEYDLVFGTKHIKGMELMKDAMWKVDPSGEYRFSDTTDPRQTLLLDYGPKEHWYPDAAKRVFDEFRGKYVGIDEISEFVIADTNYKFRSGILKILEDQGKIIVDGRKQKRKGCYPERCTIRFNS